MINEYCPRQKLSAFNLLPWEKKHFLVVFFPFNHRLSKSTLEMAEKVFNWWAQNYFLEPLSALTALVSSVIVIRKKNKESIAFIFLYYFIGYFLLKIEVLVNVAFLHLSLSKQESITPLLDYIFTLFEFWIFFTFFKKILFYNYHKKILEITFYLFWLIGCGILFYNISALGTIGNSSLTFLYNVQAVSLLIPSILYYIEIFKSAPTFNLLQTPSFWVVTGLSFFMISTLPFSILLGSLWTDNSIVFYYVFDLFHVFYIILFLMIVRAYLCKPTIKR